MNDDEQNAFSDEWSKGEAEAAAPTPATDAVTAAAKANADSDRSEYEAAHAEMDAMDAAKAPAAEKPAEKPKSFGEAFKAARAEGLKVFEFNGKKYTTEMAKPAAKPAPKAAPVAEYKPAGAPAKPFMPPTSDVPDSTQMIAKPRAAAPAAPASKPGGLAIPEGTKTVAEAVPKHAFMGKMKL